MDTLEAWERRSNRAKTMIEDILEKADDLTPLQLKARLKDLWRELEGQ